MAMDALKRTNLLASMALIFTALLLAGLLGRVAWIQKHVTADVREKLAKQSTAIIPLMAERQAILFSGGEPVALSVRMYNMFADPGFINEPQGFYDRISRLEKLAAAATGSERAAYEAQIVSLRKELEKEQADGGAQIDATKKVLVEALAPLVKKPAQELQFELEQNQFYKQQTANGTWEDTDRPRRFLWLMKEVDEDFYARFMELKSRLHEESRDVAKSEGHSKDAAARAAAVEKAAVLYHALDGIGFVKSMKRIYPMGQLAGSVIGFASPYGGVDGMERQFDDMLRGIPGSMYVTKDARRQTLLIQDQRFTAADDGRNVWLTINAVIQGIAEEQLEQAVKEHGAMSGTAVVMDPFTGRILAIANYPFFDPQHFATASPDARRDRASTDPYEPGSIWKPFVLAWALEKGIVKPTDVFDCRQGSYVDPTGRTVRDTHAVGMATVADILVKSSNIGMTQIGWKMGIPTLYEAVTKFGFGKRTGVELPGDSAGIVKPLSEWNKGTLTSVSFGYEVAATPLQLVRAFCTFANGGYLVTPRVVGAVEEFPGKAVPWSELGHMPVQTQIIRPQTAQTMRDIMKEVLGPRGTAKSAASKLYVMYGKTGTAHVAAGSHGQEGTGYSANDYDSSFLVGAPFNAPKLVAIVTLHKPDLKQGYYGGTVAAPAAVAIMERSLMFMNVPSDVPAAPVAPGRRVAAAAP